MNSKRGPASAGSPQSAWRQRVWVVLVGVGIVILTAALAGNSQAAAEKQAPAEGASLNVELALETFDAAWGIIHETYFDPTFNGLDWQAVRAELRPKVEAAETEEDLRNVLRDMVSRLGHSHMALFPREAVDVMLPKENEEEGGASGDVCGSPGNPRQAGVGVEVRLIGERVVVTEVEPGRAAAQAGVKPGWGVQAVGERSVEEMLHVLRKNLDDRLVRLRAPLAVRNRLRGREGSKVSLEFLNAADEPVKVELVRDCDTGTPIKFGNLPPLLLRFESRRLHATRPPATVGLIRFSVWMPAVARDLGRAIEEMQDVDGIVIDLRGNPGGVGAMAMGVSGYFLEEKISLGTMKTRQTELRFVANPRRPVFPGPVAILTDAMTGSTSEIFSGGMQAIGRARVFGQTSAGAALPALMDRLPNGDILYHAIADLWTASGDRLEGRGVVPDVEVPLRREDLLAGRDAALEAAVDWIAGQRNREERSRHRPPLGPALPASVGESLEHAVPFWERRLR